LLALACRTRKVESFSHISNNHSARPSPRVARLLFGKLKGPTPSRTRHHPHGVVPVSLTRERVKCGRCKHPSRLILPIKVQLMEKPRKLSRYWRHVKNSCFVRKVLKSNEKERYKQFESVFEGIVYRILKHI
jgi:hypothetical protein